MRSPDVAFIILLATLLSFAIRDSNAIYVDPRNLWTLLKQTVSNGNLLFSNWFQSTFCIPREDGETNGMSSIDLTTEADTMTDQSGRD